MLTSLSLSCYTDPHCVCLIFLCLPPHCLHGTSDTRGAVVILMLMLSPLWTLLCSLSSHQPKLLECEKPTITTLLLKNRSTVWHKINTNLSEWNASLSYQYGQTSAPWWNTSSACVLLPVRPCHVYEWNSSFYIIITIIIRDSASRVFTKIGTVLCAYLYLVF